MSYTLSDSKFIINELKELCPKQTSIDLTFINRPEIIGNHRLKILAKIKCFFILLLCFDTSCTHYKDFLIYCENPSMYFFFVVDFTSFTHVKHLFIKS